MTFAYRIDGQNLPASWPPQGEDFCNISWLTDNFNALHDISGGLSISRHVTRSITIMLGARWSPKKKYHRLRLTNGEPYLPVHIGSPSVSLLFPMIARFSALFLIYKSSLGFLPSIMRILGEVFMNRRIMTVLNKENPNELLLYLNTLPSAGIRPRGAYSSGPMTRLSGSPGA